MTELRIEQAEDLPGITVDPKKGFIEMVGKSLPEDAMVFFLPVEQAIKDYIASPKQETTIDLRLEYMNSSSQKRVVEILMLFEELKKVGLTVTINWHYPEDDDDILEEGKDLERMLKFHINFISL